MSQEDIDMTGDNQLLEESEYMDLMQRASKVFTPGAPVNERDLFAGRIEQIGRIMDAISQRGYHAVLFGDRGVGKTSLSNVIAQFNDFGGAIMPRVNCDVGDDYQSLWRKAFRDIELTRRVPTAGFVSAHEPKALDPLEGLGKKFGPDDIRRVVSDVFEDSDLVFVFDEFDRLKSAATNALMADTIKSFSDYSLDATILIIGVADSVDGLIQEHRSIERALVQVHLPRMSDDEVRSIILTGLRRLGMKGNPDALAEIVALSQGLPYVAHLLALHSSRAALSALSKDLQLNDVQEGVRKSLEQWQQSVVAGYYNAVLSHQPGNIFREVLAACAQAKPDELGFFKASAVRTPLRIITGKDYDIPSFARHLNEFAKDARGPILQRTGEKRRIRYRFVSPLMRPYVTMRSFSDDILDREKIAEIAKASGLARTAD
jgi:hypothetical protein